MTDSSSTRSSASQTSLQLDALLDWVSTQTGLSFRGQRDNAKETLRKALHDSGDTSSDNYRKRLESDRGAFDDLIGELTIGETYFFRDKSQFDLITNDFLRHINKIRPQSHKIRIWSAGCASGEEVWSLAVVLAEADLAYRGHVLGTDISRPSLMRAQTGRYREWSLRGEAVQRMRPWISEQAGTYTIVPRLRPTVSFEYLNLAEDTYPSFASNTVGLDLILCRNVLIYFDHETIARVSERLYQCLSPGGWLITGASDPPLGQFAPFEVQSTAAGRVYIRPDELPPLPELTSQSEIDTVDDLRPSRINSVSTSEHVTTTPSAGRSYQPQVNAAKASIATDAAAALDQGNYVRVLKLTANQLADAKACELRVRALANLDVEHAERFCCEALAQHRISKELNYLNAILLTELSRYEDAASAAKRVVFLDPDLAVGHMALGTVLQRLGDFDGAGRAFRNARRICQSQAAHETVPLADGEQAGRMAESASRHLSLLIASRKRKDGSF